MFESFSGRGALLIAGAAGVTLILLASLCTISADAAPVTSPAGEGQTTSTPTATSVSQQPTSLPRTGGAPTHNEGDSKIDHAVYVLVGAILGVVIGFTLVRTRRR